MGARCLRWSPILFAASLALVACGGGKRGDGVPNPPRQDGGIVGLPDATVPIEPCGLAGRYRVSTVQPALPGCGALPSVGEVLVIETGTTGFSLIAGELEMPLDPGSMACELVSSGCRHDAAGDRWISAHVELEKTTSLRVAIDLDEVSAHEQGSCTGRVELEAVPDPPLPCGFDDTILVDAAPSLTSGACDLSWTAEEVRLVREEGELVAHWGDRFSSDVATLDETTCTLTIQKGVLPNIWIFNGVPRHLDIQIQRMGTNYQGTIEDRLEGTSDFGETCDAMFAFTAKKLELGGDLVLPNTCGIVRPYVRGDGRCEMDREEGCLMSTSDCGCLAPQECISRGAGLCAVACNVLSDSCAANERCDLADDFGPDGYCVAAGPLGEGRRCASHAECGHGLLCQVDWDEPILEGICLRVCDPAVMNSPACDTLCTQHTDNFDVGGCKIACDATIDDVCGGDDAFCWRRASNQDPFCWPVPAGGVPGLNEDCNSEAGFRGPRCAGALDCIGLSGRFFCSPECSTSDDCPAVLPVCHTSFLDHCVPSE